MGKEKLSFKIVIQSITGTGLDPKQKFACSWTRGEKETNAGGTPFEKVLDGAVTWDHSAVIESVLVKDGNNYKAKTLVFTIEQRDKKKGSEATVFGQATVDLSKGVGPEKQHSVDISGDGKSSVLLNYRVGTSETKKDVVEEPPLASPPEEKTSPRHRLFRDPASEETSRPPAMLRSQEAVENESANSFEANEITPLTLHILGLSGAVLQPMKGKSFRVEYRYDKELQRQTKFAECRDSLVTWYHWMYLPALAKGSKGRLKFLLELGSEVNAKELSSFVCNVSSFVRKIGKQVKFPIKFDTGLAYLHVGVQTFQGDPPKPLAAPIVIQENLQESIMQEKIKLAQENEDLRRRVQDLETASNFSGLSNTPDKAPPRPFVTKGPAKNTTRPRKEEMIKDSFARKARNVEETSSAPFEEAQDDGVPAQKSNRWNQPSDDTTKPKERPTQRRRQQGTCDDLCLIL